MIARDKQLHFLGGLVLALVLTPFMPWQVALTVVITVGIGKEIYDWFHPANHSTEFMDALATIAGGILGIILITIW